MTSRALSASGAKREAHRGPLPTARNRDPLPATQNRSPPHGPPFELERVTDNIWHFRLGDLADTVLEMNKGSSSPQGKQMTPLVTNDKNARFQKESDVSSKS